MEVIIVKNDKELQDAYQVRTTVFVDEQQVPPEEEIDQYEKDATHFVLYTGNEPIGAGRLRDVDGYAKVERICVLKSYREQGVGQKIMDKIEETAIAQGFTKFKLNAQTTAEAFYKKLGYETVSGEFLDAGIPHVTMVKTVS